MQMAVISWNEKGFWQGDLYLDWSPEDPEGVSPDNFFTCGRTATLFDAKRQAAFHWPDAHIKVVENHQT